MTTHLRMGHILLTRINPNAIHAPAGQYSHAVRVQSGTPLLYIAGQVGITPQGQLIADFEGQVRQAWENLLHVLISEGVGAANLVHVNSYVVDGQDIDLFREVRKHYLPSPPPSSTTLIVPRLVSPKWLFEIDAVATAAAPP